ncbi:hypothetical protein [Antribacter soli]|nr:hypothetical protein [Antribacter soli]
MTPRWGLEPKIDALLEERGIHPDEFHHEERKELALTLRSVA